MKGARPCREYHARQKARYLEVTCRQNCRLNQARLKVSNQAKTTRTFIKRLRGAASREEAVALLPKVTSMLDRLAKKNVIHKNKAANNKSKLTKFVNAL